MWKEKSFHRFLSTEAALDAGFLSKLDQIKCIDNLYIGNEINKYYSELCSMPKMQLQISE